MAAETYLKVSLVDVLENLMQTPKSFDETVLELFKYNYNDYNQWFEIEKMDVERETYRRVPVYKSQECVAILMIWGEDNTTAIHDHNNYDGRIKVLRGSLTEVSYRENSNFIEYNGVGTAYEGQIFPEEYGGIHSIVNNNKGISVSLHVYRTSQLNLKGVRLFDTVNRRVAWLSDNATSCSWNLGEDAYQKIVNI